ncbi:hypothetical protein FMM68_07195 [Lachnospiraceae bacterium MD329]|nr:hypothetical protein [Lachnospiraceae bacterium MD329]
MKNIGIVRGNSEQAKELVIGKDKVYIHTDITPITTDTRGNEVKDLFEYHEIQYDKDEYIELLAKQNAELTSGLTDTQLALCEIYEATN